MLMHRLIREELGVITNLLVKKEYDVLEAVTHGVRLTAEDICCAVEEYGHVLVPVPLNAFEAVDIIKISGSHPRAWSVVCPLWSQAEGRSKLTLELTMVERGFHKFAIEIDNIHVL